VFPETLCMYIYFMDVIRDVTSPRHFITQTVFGKMS
jgi:hypothetical protein